jgi:hypothetical protein
MPQAQTSIPSGMTSAPAIAGPDGPQPLPADILALLAALPGGSPPSPGGAASSPVAPDELQSFSRFFPVPASASGSPGKLSETMMPFRPGEQDPRPQKTDFSAEADPTDPGTNPLEAKAPVQTSAARQAAMAVPGPKDAFSSGAETGPAAIVQAGAEGYAANPAAPSSKGSRKNASTPAAAAAKAPRASVAAKAVPASARVDASVAPAPEAATIPASVAASAGTVVRTNRWQSAAGPVPASFSAANDRGEAGAESKPLPPVVAAPASFPAAASVAPTPEGAAIQTSLAASAEMVVQTNRWQAPASVAASAGTVVPTNRWQSAAGPVPASFSAADDRGRTGAESNPLPAVAADPSGAPGSAAMPASPGPQGSRWQAAPVAFPSSPAGQDPKADTAQAVADDPSAGGGAKFAAAAAQSIQGPYLGQMGSEKKSLPVVHQKDDATPSKVGISSAPVASAMPAQTADRSSPATGTDLFRALPAQEVGSVAPAATAQEASPNARAAQAVETVVALVDAQTGRAQGASSAVKINFNINGDDLAVRIEVSNGAVRTQFHTDSPELRAALATQWQAAAPSVSGKALSFQQPTFSGAPGNSDSASSADGGASRRQARPDAEDENPSWTPTGAKSATPRQPATGGTVPARISGGRLHAFA